MKYIPDRFDIAYINLHPQSGQEINKRRPCLILSPKTYNKFGKVLVCPITNTKKGLGVEVALPNHLQTSGVIIADQVKSLDWRSRAIKYYERLDDLSVYEEVIAIIITLMIEGSELDFKKIL